MTPHDFPNPERISRSFNDRPAFVPEPVPAWFKFFLLAAFIGFGLAWAASI